MVADKQKLPRPDARRQLETGPLRAVPCRRSYLINPIFELGDRKKVSMKKKSNGRGRGGLYRERERLVKGRQVTEHGAG